MRLSYLVFVLIGALVLAGCAKRETPKEYPLKGVVVRVDEKAKTATIKHERIEGWMEAMTMEFPVHDEAELRKLTPGAKVEGTLYVTGDNYHLGNVRVTP
ncbi:MAG: copper-binding protein [Bryobacteraceae bacterium]